MIAFALVFTIFLFWSVTGFAIVSLLNGGRNLLRNALLSPSVGAGITALLVVLLNRAGLPVKHGGPIVTASLLMAAGLIFWRLRPIVPVRQLRQFVIIIVIGAVVTGYPLLRFGFNWVSFSNDDMANYSLGADMFLNHAYTEEPEAETVIRDLDPTVSTWYFYFLNGIRSGSEETLSWVVSCTGLTSHQIFMPTILALHLALISAVGAMVFLRRKYLMPAVAASAGAALSAQLTFGTLYQLIAQTFGLGLLVTLSTLMLRPFADEPWRVSVRRSILHGILGAALGVVYPELSPFFVLSFAIYHAIQLLRKLERAQPFFKMLALSILGPLIFLNVLLPSVISTLYGQAHIGLGPNRVGNIIFPYFLVPAGLAHLWGFFGIGQPLSTPFLNVYIVVGAILLLLCIAGAARQAWDGQSAAVVFLVMLALGLNLFARHIDFGVYKLAMYIQPFLISVAVLSLFHLVRTVTSEAWKWRDLALIGPLAVTAAFGMQAHLYYTQSSLGRAGSGLVEIQGASESRLVAQLIELAKTPHNVTVISETDNMVLGKFQRAYFNFNPVYFPTQDYFFKVGWPIPKGLFKAYLNFTDAGVVERAETWGLARAQRVRYVTFDMHTTIPQTNAFRVRSEIEDLRGRQFDLIESSSGVEVLNRWGNANDRGEATTVRVTAGSAVRNRLVFIDSELGNGYFNLGVSRSQGLVSLYQPEGDYFRPGHTMISIGRILLFRILNPSSKIRLVVDYTASLNADGQNSVPPASAIGADREPFKAQGRGSARLFSPVLMPQLVGAGEYVGLDMGTWGSQFPDRRTGMMLWYGKDISLDPRRIVGFARDISAISEDEYLALQAPSHLSKFPSDLANRNLEYSGIYEDGWVAESSVTNLAQPKEARSLHLRIMVPGLSKGLASSQVTVFEDGVKVTHQPLAGGINDVHIPVTQNPARHTIKLVFDRATSLPTPDNRPVSALIKYLGYE